MVEKDNKLYWIIDHEDYCWVPGIITNLINNDNRIFEGREGWRVARGVYL